MPVIQQKLDYRKLRFMKKKKFVYDKSTGRSYYEVTLEELKRYLKVLGIKWSSKGFYCYAYKGIELKIIPNGNRG